MPIDSPLAASSRARSAMPAGSASRAARASAGSAGMAARTSSTTAGVVRRPVTEPGGELPLGDRVGNRRKVAHPSEVQLPRRRGEDVGVGDEDVGPSRLDGAFRARDDEDAAVGDETVDAAGGLDRDVMAAGALRGDLRDVGERSGSHGDQQPVGPTSATARSTVSSSARTVPVPSWTTGQPSCSASRSTTGPARRAVRPAVAEDHRPRSTNRADAVGDALVQHRRADADVDVGQVGVPVVRAGSREGPRGRER